MSNLYGVMSARHTMFPHVKQKGMADMPKLVVFTSKYVSIPIYGRLFEYVLIY